MTGMVNDVLKMMYLFLILLSVPSVIKSDSQIENYVQRRAYDYDLYESVLDPELCQRHLRQMSAFESMLWPHFIVYLRKNSLQSVTDLERGEFVNVFFVAQTEVYDASFRVPQSIFRGNTFSLGQYHQCLAINQPLENGSIRGKYCLFQTQSLYIPILSGDNWPGNVTWVETKNVWTDKELEEYAQTQRELSAFTGEDSSRTIVVDIINAVPMTLALCIPRACSVHDVLGPLTRMPFVEFNYTEDYCRLPEDKPYSGADIAAVVVFSVIGLLTLLSTSYELHHIFIKKATTAADELLSCFSAYRNTDQLLTLGDKPRALDCLDGIRSLSILWVILGHTFLVNLTEYLSNIFDFLNWSSHLKSFWLIAADVSVDSFLTLSGLLLVYTSVTKLKQMQLVKGLHMFYLHRLLRMFPLLAAAVLLQASVFHQVADGVRWNRVAWETQNCRDYWWSALLHIQNLVNVRDICLSHGWYLSVDVQMHILSPLLLFWVLGSRRSAWTGLATGVLASLIGVTIYCYIKEFSGEHDIHYAVYFYQNTFARSPPFIIGMLTGYLLHLSRGKRMTMHPVVVCIGYVLAIAISWYCLYHRHAGWDSELFIIFNTALMRAGWGASLCWLVLVCVNGYADPINWFLSLKIWKFIARISYAMYLFHFPLQFVARGANIMPIYFSMESMFMYFASDAMYTVIVSVAACVLIDAPCSTLIKRLMTAITPKRPASPVKKTEQAVHETNETQQSEEKTRTEYRKTTQL